MSSEQVYIEPFFSVVVPMFNVENYIDECLESVTQQSFISVEIIIIDDGSTDKSVAHCFELMELGHKFILLGQRQSGPNVARNLALQHVTGKYVLFMDADDKLSPGALEILHTEITSHPVADVISFGYTFFDDKTRVIRAGVCPPRRHLTADDIFVEALIGQDFGGVCWNKCYCCNFLLGNNITFIPDTVHGRDLLFSRSVAFYAQNWFSFNARIYQSRFRMDSFSRNFSEKNVFSALDVAYKHLEIFRDAAIKREILPQLNFAVCRHLRYIILLGAFRACCYKEYKKYFEIISDSPLWSLPKLESVYRCDRIFDKVISALIKVPRLCWVVSRTLKRFNYEPY